MSYGIKVISVCENADGSADLEVEITSEFKEGLKRTLGMKRWSNKKFQEFAIKALNSYTKDIIIDE